MTTKHQLHAKHAKHAKQALASVAFGYGSEVRQIGVLSEPSPGWLAEASRETGSAQESLVDQACLEAFETSLDGRHIELAYTAEFRSKSQAQAFADFLSDAPDDSFWVDELGTRVRFGFDGALNKELLLAGCAAFRLAAASFGGELQGWGLRDPGQAWMYVNQVALEAPRPLH